MNKEMENETFQQRSEFETRLGGLEKREWEVQSKREEIERLRRDLEHEEKEMQQRWEKAEEEIGKELSRLEKWERELKQTANHLKDVCRVFWYRKRSRFVGKRKNRFSNRNAHGSCERNGCCKRCILEIGI